MAGRRPGSSSAEASSALEGLATALALHATTFWPGRIVSNSYVTKHIVVGSLICPDGTRPEIAAVWKIEPGTTVARLVTAYPHR